MVTKKAVIGIVIVAVVAFMVLAVAVGDSNKDPNARYNYDIEFIDSFDSSIGGLPQTPDEGKKFMVLNITIINDDSKDDITTNPFIFEWYAVENGIKHTYLDDESLSPTPSSVEIVKGGQAKMVYCWQIGKDVSVDDITVGFEYPSWHGTVFEHDKSIGL